MRRTLHEYFTVKMCSTSHFVDCRGRKLQTPEINTSGHPVRRDAIEGGKMFGRFYGALSGCLCTCVLFSPAAEAADGRITFLGSIVVPTCHVAADAIASARTPVRPRRSCTGPASIRASSRIYTVTSRRLTHAESDSVLNYFDSYISASRADAAPTLVTQTYE